jgi:hypothetical protein
MAWIDPAHGFLTRRLLLFYQPVFDPSKTYIEHNLQSCAQIGGIWFPTKTTMTAHTAGKSTSIPAVTETTFSNIEVNPILPPSTFTVAIPKGTPIIDEHVGRSFANDSRDRKGAPDVGTPLPPPVTLTDGRSANSSVVRLVVAITLIIVNFILAIVLLRHCRVVS